MQQYLHWAAAQAGCQLQLHQAVLTLLPPTSEVRQRQQPVQQRLRVVVQLPLEQLRCAALLRQTQQQLLRELMLKSLPLLLLMRLLPRLLSCEVTTALVAAAVRVQAQLQASDAPGSGRPAMQARLQSLLRRM